MTLTVGSLFAGIGGFDLGLERAGMSVRWQVENNPYCQRVLAKHWPHVQRYGDIRAIDWGTVPRVDLLCGGFPCQDISLAGKGAGLRGDRSGLWREYVRAIEALTPRYVLIENVSALRARGLDQVLGALATLGYDAEWDVLSACAFGAPHTRERVFILAYAKGARFLQCRRIEQSKNCARERNVHYWENQSEPLRVAHGVPARVDRLRGLGNAVVPQIVEWLGRCIINAQEAQHDESRLSQTGTVLQ